MASRQQREPFWSTLDPVVLSIFGRDCLTAPNQLGSREGLIELRKENYRNPGDSCYSVLPREDEKSGNICEEHSSEAKVHKKMVAWQYNHKIVPYHYCYLTDAHLHEFV